MSSSSGKSASGNIVWKHDYCAYSSRSLKKPECYIMFKYSIHWHIICSSNIVVLRAISIHWTCWHFVRIPWCILDTRLIIDNVHFCAIWNWRYTRRNLPDTNIQHALWDIASCFKVQLDPSSFPMSYRRGLHVAFLGTCATRGIIYWHSHSFLVPIGWSPYLKDNTITENLGKLIEIRQY